MDNRIGLAIAIVQDTYSSVRCRLIPRPLVIVNIALD